MGVKIKGGEAGSIKKLKSDLKKSSGEGTWVRFIPKDEDLTVRFLTEPTEWFKYDEHYEKEVGFFPCTGDDCPGCASDDKPSRKYLANVLDIDNERVVPLKLPVTLANRLIARHERHGTLTDRDYILMRSGASFNNTVYDAESEPPSRRKLSKYEDSKHDLEQVLVQSFEEAFGEDSDDDSDDEPSRKKSSGKRLKTSGDTPVRKKRSSASKGKKKKTTTSSRRRRR